MGSSADFAALQLFGTDGPGSDRARGDQYASGGEVIGNAKFRLARRETRRKQPISRCWDEETKASDNR